MHHHESAVYATQPRPLRQQLEELLQAASPPAIAGDIQALIVPDANLVSGGAIAATVYKTLENRRYDTVILVAPSHTGPFRRMTICRVDTYQTPLGALRVNDKVRNELCDEEDDIFLDDTGHFHVDGIDVQLPFLQLMLPAFDIVPVVMGEETPEMCRELGYAIGEVSYNQRTLVVACANVLAAAPEALNRFEEALRALDVSRLMQLLNSEQVLMQGKGAVLVAVLAALHRRANLTAEIVALQPPAEDRPGFIGAVIATGGRDRR
ncbi:MAG: hypothetical protein KatS3mg043_1899 [Rhodothermaceae bacterium]|nr:MAG: hypothetical protein KatS3mg043_1899 [Rhodothermaceae bacterium]